MLNQKLFLTMTMDIRIREHKKEAFKKAIDSLSRYKFMQFGYWAAIWVHLNRIDEEKEKNPFYDFVRLAKETIKEKLNNDSN